MARIRLKPKGYEKICKLVDKRDNGRCIICHTTQGIQHHHVIFRSACGSDLPNNLVCLCNNCHSIYAHGKTSKKWQKMFIEYLNDSKQNEFHKEVNKEVSEIIKRYGINEKVRCINGEQKDDV